MVFSIITTCLLVASTSAISPKSPMPKLGDSVVAYDSNGTITIRSRIYYNQNDWIDSVRAFDVESGSSFVSSSVYALHGDTLIQSRFNDGEPSSEMSRHIFDNSKLVQKELHYMGDTLIEIIFYYYNQAGIILKRIASSISNQWIISDSVIFNYDTDGHLVSTMEYFSNSQWSYTEFEHDAQGRPTKLIEFNNNSATQKSGWYLILIHLDEAPLLGQYVDTPKKPGIRIDQDCTLLSLDPSEVRQIRVYDAKGALLKNIRPDEFNSSRQNGIPVKACFIKVFTSDGLIYGKKINVR